MFSPAKAGARLLLVLSTAVAGTVISACLVRYAPGFGTDSRELDARLGGDFAGRLRQEAEQRGDLSTYLTKTLQGALRGDFGVSHSLGEPVADLLLTRGAVTLNTLVWGVGSAWILGFAAAVASTAPRGRLVRASCEVAATLCIATPPAVLALVFFVCGGPLALALAMALFPKVFRFTSNLLRQIQGRPHVMLARAKGLARWLIWTRHILPLALPQYATLAAATITVGFGALIPLEVVAGVPGVGRLAWQAALSRDLPLLVAITTAVAVVTLLAGAVADIAGGSERRAA